MIQTKSQKMGGYPKSSSISSWDVSIVWGPHGAPHGHHPPIPWPGSPALGPAAPLSGPGQGPKAAAERAAAAAARGTKGHGDFMAFSKR